MKKILAIADKRGNLKNIKAVITSNIPDCKVLTAQSGKKGIKIAQKKQPDTILLDIIMHEMDGYEVCKRLKEGELTKHIPVIMITAIETDPKYLEKGFENGVDTFLSKPIDPVEFSVQVNVMLRIKKAKDKLLVEKDVLEKLVLERTKELRIINKDLTIEISERKQAEDKLRDAEANLKNTFDISPGLICVANVNTGYFTECNQAVTRILGISVGEFTSKPFVEFIHPDDRHRTVDEMKKQLDGSQTAMFENRYLCKDGSYKWLTWQATTADKNGKVYAVATDTTERKKAEQDLLLTQFSVDNSTDAVYWMEKDAKFIYVNNEAIKVLGYSKEELLKMTAHDIGPDFPKEGWSAHWAELIEKKSFVIQTIHQRKDKTIFPVEITVNFIKFNGFEINCAIAKDITERKKSEEDLKKTEDQYKSLFNQIPDPVIVFDQETKMFFDCNKAMINKYGYMLGELSEMTPLDLYLADEDMERVKRNIDDKEKTLPNEYMHKGKDGTIYNVETHTQKIFYKGREAFITIIRDVTECKKAFVKATESDRLKSVFLASMSHELRTPLNAINGFSDLIDKDLHIDKIIDYTKIINLSGNHLLSIIDDLFDVTLIESGEMKIIKENVELQFVLQSVLEIIKAERQKTNKGSIDLNLIIPPEGKDLIFNTDSSKLKQILINLLKNALKFTHQGHISYGYSIATEQGKPVLKFYVEDTGDGIPKDKQELIFDIFRQADDSHTSMYGGTGLGLSIAKKLVELLDGKIWIESKQGKGSTFYFTIPFDEHKEISKSIIKEVEKENSFKKKTILIVEDDASSFFYLRTVLKKWGVNVIWAKDGVESIKLCKENTNIDLVLMDINLPVMNGYKATKDIKKFRPELPIIAQTAYAINGDREKALEAGCDDYITKPIKKGLLSGLIQKQFRI